ncbi:MAG TPA: helix-turn-helix domain-containing protein [Arenimonas sp.]|nr:helix-turn-helix domain-containing protein [Arenimonas sp.]
MPQPTRVSLVALPEASISTLHGIHDVLGCFPAVRGVDPAIPDEEPFAVSIVAERAGPVTLAGGLKAEAQRGIGEVDDADIVIVPSVLLGPDGWQTGRYPALVAWLARMHARGAMLCSACSGVFLIAETGLLDGRAVTIHWIYERRFAALYPRVVLQPEQALVVAGERAELVSSGASMSWHDLVLYLVARVAGPAVAQSVARFFALQWHRDGLGPYIVFEGRRDHGDALILEAQRWLERHYPVPAPVEKMAQHTGLAERTFKRRFQAATGLAPLAYVQHLRVEEAKRRLERGGEPVDEVGWRVGYEDSAFFRRLFRRITGVTPGQYRRQFQMPTPGS